jgi:hypothetical protein
MQYNVPLLLLSDPEDGLAAVGPGVWLARAELDGVPALPRKCEFSKLKMNVW